MNLPAVQETLVQYWVRKISWRKEWLPTPVFFPGKSMDRGTWVAIVHGVTGGKGAQLLKE